MARSKLLLLLIIIGLCLSACGETTPTVAVSTTAQGIATVKPATATPALAVTTSASSQTSTAPTTVVASVTTPASTIAGDPVPDTYEYIGETTDSGASWTILDNFVDRKNKQFTSNNQLLNCVAAKTCFNTNGEKDTNNAAFFEMVKDGSKNWKYFRTFNTSDISCISTSECWKLIINTQNDGVFATKDGGATWNNLTQGKSLTVNDASKPAYLKNRRNETLLSELSFTHKIKCFDANRCLLLGEGRSIRTLDGGKTWDWFFTEPSFSNNIVCFDETNCYSVSSNAITFTKNFGESWQKFTLPVKVGNFKAMSCASINFCVAGGDEGNFLTTNDKGATWKKHSILEKESLSDVSCPDENTCYVVIAKATLQVTRDAGKTWNGRPIVLEDFEGYNSKISCPTTTNCLIYYSKTEN